jgi:hypothetical protein
MLYFALSYRSEGFFVGMNVNYAANNFPLDGGTYMAVDGSVYYDTWNSKYKFAAMYDNKLPAYAVASGYVGRQFMMGPINTTVSLQVLNLTDNYFLADADRNGVVPGLTRSMRFNLSLGM